MDSIRIPIECLDLVESAEWNTLAGDNPFLRHEFLAALEHCGVIGPDTSWRPQYLIARDAQGYLIGALLLYLKHDSRGEFVFDWGWAEAYERAGERYYPKFVSAVPFTPATGHRLLIHPDHEHERPAISRQLLTAARNLLEELPASSLHVLFPITPDHAALEDAGLLVRKGCQFHWHNNGYRDFDDFLDAFSSAKRKKARRERRRIAEAGIVFEHLRGNELDAHEWDTIYAFHARTFHLHGREPYLNRAFFDEISRTMPANLVVLLARYHGQPIAAAICFRGGDTFYGRYWGSLADFHSLHFETCYHQGIEYCIREGLQRFEPGTQGEHKISRGFTPTPTWSYHWLADSGFQAAVADFLTRESCHVDAYMDDLDKHLPYRHGRDGA